MVNPVAQALRSLRAVRDFTSDPISDELVDDWLESARWCGSSKNSQPWRFIVVRDRAVLDELATLGSYTHHLSNAPVGVALAAVPGPYEFSTVFDLGRVAQSLMTAAHADGVGSCIAVFEPEPNINRARGLLGVPEAWRLDLAIALGWPRRGPAPVLGVSPSGRRPLEGLTIQHEAER